MEPIFPVSDAAVRRRRTLKLRSLEAAAVVHTLAAAWFLRVWLWHLTPAAAPLPGRQGFGWFVRFLTFYSYSIQTATLVIAAADDWSKLLMGRSRFTKLADDLSSALFALAHVVTILFYTIQTATKAMVEGNVERPYWLNSSVHLYNTGAAWADLLTSHRSFSRRSEQMSSVMIVVYLLYIQLCRYMNGRFPYPFLNKLRQPHGFVGTTAAGLLLFAGAFRVGRAINRRVRAVHVSIAEEGDTITIQAVKAPRGGGGCGGGGSGGGAHHSGSGGGAHHSGSGGGGAPAGRWRPMRLTSLGGAVYVAVRRRSAGGVPGGAAPRGGKALVAAGDME